MSRWKASLMKDSYRARVNITREWRKRIEVAYLLVNVELAEDLGSIKEVGVVDNPKVGALAVVGEDAPERRHEPSLLLNIPGEERQVEDQGQPVAVNQEQEREKTVDGGFRNDVGVETVAEVNGVDVVARRGKRIVLAPILEARRAATKTCRATRRARFQPCRATYHSKSLYMMVKKTCRNRLTALINTDNRNSHASPDIIVTVFFGWRQV